MEKVIIIAGMGQGLSMAIAQKFGSKGYKIGMISRSEDKLREFKDQLAQQNITSAYAAADLANTKAMFDALKTLKTTLGDVSVLQYNAVDYRMKHILQENVEDLTNGFKVSVANAFAATMELLPELTANKGSVLFTGGDISNYPNPDMASISMGKAGIRNLALQLHEVLKPQNIFVGTVTIAGWINPESETHSPKIIAEKFWELNEARNQVEMLY